MLEKYTHTDDQRIKELTLKLEKLATESDKLQKQLESEAVQGLSYRIGLDKAGDEFRRIHAEQQQLSRLWQDTINTMEQRDAEVAQQAERFEELRRKTAERVGVGAKRGFKQSPPR